MVFHLHCELDLSSMGALLIWRMKAKPKATVDGNLRKGMLES